jgi:hypothetical protein
MRAILFLNNKIHVAYKSAIELHCRIINYIATKTR